jgi:hypothetical protein
MKHNQSPELTSLTTIFLSFFIHHDNQSTIHQPVPTIVFHSRNGPPRSADHGRWNSGRGDGLTFVRKKTKDFTNEASGETPKKLPSGYDKQFAMERSNMLLSLVNHLFLWAIYTMAMLVITRG